MDHSALAIESDTHKQADDQRFENLVEQNRGSIEQQILEMLAIADISEQHFQICALDEAVENHFKAVRIVREHLEQSMAFAASVNIKREYQDALAMETQCLREEFPALFARLTGEKKTAGINEPAGSCSSIDVDGDDGEPEALPIGAYTGDLRDYE